MARYFPRQLESALPRFWNPPRKSQPAGPLVARGPFEIAHPAAADRRQQLPSRADVGVERGVVSELVRPAKQALAQAPSRRVSSASFPNEDLIVRAQGHCSGWSATIIGRRRIATCRSRGFAEPADKSADLKPLQITPKAA